VPLFQAMIESIANDQGSYTPGISWVYDPRTGQIRIDWLPGFDAKGLGEQERVASARADGWNSADIWSYYASGQSYNGIITTRSTPEPIIAPTLDAAVLGVLQRMAQMGSSR